MNMISKQNRWAYKVSIIVFILHISSFVLADVSINGKVYKGKQVVVKGENVLVDGKVVQEQSVGILNITVTGNIDQVITDRSVKVMGDIKGSVQASGRVVANTIHGNVKATGSVTAKQIKGHVKAVGRVSCEAVHPLP